MGFDGVEIPCWGDHFEVDKALESDAYIKAKKGVLEKHKLKYFAISNHLVGQCVCDDPIDQRHKSILPARLWGDGKAEGVRQRCIEEMKDTARAAKRLGVSIVNGFTGSSIWPKLYFFPPTTQKDVDAGYRDFADRWLPILDVFKKEGVKFAMEVHPAEIAYDIITARRALQAIGDHPSFGFNFDPSHLVHQFVNPVYFLEEFGPRIFHMHVKDTRLQLTGRSSILSSHLDFGHPDRGWDFCTVGRGDIKWDMLFRTLNRIGYGGPLSIEWEDSGMDREWGAREALAFTRRQDFAPAAGGSFDSAFTAEKKY